MRFISLFALAFAACGGTTLIEPTVAAAGEHGEHAGHEHGAGHEQGAHADPAPVMDGEWAVFGEPMTSDNTVALSALLDSPDTFTGQTIRVQGTIADVCQKAGCWMVIADGERTMRVTMKGHGFGVAKDAATRIGEIEGVVISRAADPERTAHFAGEAANPEAMPENSGADTLYEIDASGVRIKNS